MRDSFLRQTAASILQQMEWKQLSRTTLVLPSHRAGLVLKDELLRLQQERHAQAVWAPTVQTLTQLQDALSPLYEEDELFTIVRLYRIYRSTFNLQPSTTPMPLDLFYGWGRQMLADFTNIDASMTADEVPNFFENTIAAHELEQWKLDPETEERLRGLMGDGTNGLKGERDSIRAQYEVLWRQIGTYYQALHAEMEAEQKGYAGMRQRAVITHWSDDLIQQQIEGRTYIFVGFNYLLPVERDLMLRLRDAGQALFYWDFVTNFETNEKAFSFAQLNSTILGSAMPPRTWGEARKVTVTACSSRESQAQYVHRWLQQNYTEKGQRVGVVICDETMLEPVIYTLPAITLPGQTAPEPINITKGFPLRNTAIYIRAVAWLSDSARGKGTDRIEPELIDRMMEALFGGTTTSETEQAPEETPLGWKELLVLESEYQVRKILNQLRQIITDGIGDVPFTLKLLRLLMRRMMESVTMPFHGEPVTDMQVMGVLETRLLDFDKLLLLNVEEGIIPQRQTDSSFIPYYLRKTYHMQTSDERATVYAYNFFRLLSRAGEATILYATAETAESGKGMSRFIMQMLYSPEFEVTRTNLLEPSVLTAFQETEEQTSSLLSGLVVEDGIVKRPDGKRYMLSPSALNTYISCPRSFYRQYVLGLPTKQKQDVLFEPNTMGSFVHHAMEYLYRTYLNCDNTHPVPVSPDEIEAIRTNPEAIQAALDAAYEAMNADQQTPYIQAHHAGENVVIKGYINNILERDREDAKTGLSICQLEQDYLFPVQLDGVGEILTGGKVDRMDIYGAPGQECLRIVDYKSGSYNDKTHALRMSSSWEELMDDSDKSYVRQTLVYSHAVQVHDRSRLPIEPHLFFCRRKLTDITTTIDVEGQTVHDYKAIRDLFMENLQRKAKEVLTTTDFPKCEPDQCPSHCHFFDLCGRKPKEF